MEVNKVYCGDCLDVLKTLPENSVDSICCDPPYELGFMGKSWDNTGIANNKEMWAECLRVLKPGGHLLAFSGTRTYHRMASAIEDAGFEVRDMIEWVMGSGFPKSLNIFKQLEKRCDCGIMSEYGERTTKNTKHYLRPLREADIQKAKHITEEQREILFKGLPKQGLPTEEVREGLFISERAGEPSMEGRCYLFQKEGELYRCAICQMSAGVFSDGEKGWLYNGAPTCNGNTYRETFNEDGSGASREPQSRRQQDREPCAFCKQFGAQAIRAYGWGSAMKPAHEPICVARKPLSESNIADNFLKYGTGGINIDESRVGTEESTVREIKNVNREWGGLKNPFTGGSTTGRFPANLIHDNSEEVIECFPNESERFFKSIIYQAKASKSERNKGLDSIVLVDILKVWNENNTTKEEKLIRLMVTGISPQKVIGESGVQLKNANEWNTCLFGKHLMEKYQKDIKFITKTETNSITTSQTLNWLTHLLTNEYTVGANLEMGNGGNLVENAENSNTLIITISEAMALALGVKDVVSGMQLKINVKEGSNIHSTVKPIALMEYLIKMVTPKGGIVLDPFAGSGSTLVAAKQNGYQYIGIEMTEEYIPIIEARLKADVVVGENLI